MSRERRAKLIAGLGSRLLRVLLATLRFHVVDHAGAFQLPMRVPLLWAFWHNRLLVVPYLFERYFPGRPGAALTSASSDGEIVASFIECFGVGAVRGSSSRGGARAMVEMRRRVQTGEMMAITPDGPRGPRYRLNPGLVKLAQLTGGVILPVRIEYSSYWELKSWDAFRIPKPFARVDVIFDATLTVTETADETAFEVERVRLEGLLRPGAI
jgi:lysophospholipid acyltransferase (LPLAT)-like uncharacterized protein